MQEAHDLESRISNALVRKNTAIGEPISITFLVCKANMSVDIAQVVRQRLTTTTLSGSDCDLSFHGKSRATYIYAQPETIARYIELIDRLVRQNHFTQASFDAAFDFHDMNDAIAALTICKAFESIHDAFTRNLNDSFHHGGGVDHPMPERFPELFSWTIPRDEIRRLRNKCAHGCGIDPLYIGDRTSDAGYGIREPFVSTEFWQKVIALWLPHIRIELYDLLFLLRRDLTTMDDLEEEDEIPEEVPSSEESSLAEVPEVSLLCVPVGLYLWVLGLFIWLWGAIESIYSTSSTLIDAVKESVDARHARMKRSHRRMKDRNSELRWQLEAAKQVPEGGEADWQE